MIKNKIYCSLSWILLLVYKPSELPKVMNWDLNITVKIVCKSCSICPWIGSDLYLAHCWPNLYQYESRLY